MYHSLRYVANGCCVVQYKDGYLAKISCCEFIIGTKIMYNFNIKIMQICYEICNIKSFIKYKNWVYALQNSIHVNIVQLESQNTPYDDYLLQLTNQLLFNN